MNHRSAAALRRSSIARRRARSGRGAVVVEFGLVAPLFILLVFGIVDFGWMINRNTLVTNVARDAVRVGSLDGSYHDIALAACNGLIDVGIGGFTGTNDPIGAQSGSKQAGCIANAVGKPGTPTKGNVVVRITCESCGTDNANATTFDGDIAPGQQVTVSVVYNHGWLTPMGAVCGLFGGSCVGNSIVLTHTGQMVRE